MAASRKEIKEWFKEGKDQGATHMVVVCDQWDWFDYPVFVTSDKSAKEMLEEIRRQSMQVIMEVYNLSLPLDSQLMEERAWNL